MCEVGPLQLVLRNSGTTASALLCWPLTAYAKCTFCSWYACMRSPHLSPCPPPCPFTLPPGVLNRAEWVKFVALFFNQERAASDIFAAIKAEYEATKVGSHHQVSLCHRKSSS